MSFPSAGLSSAANTTELKVLFTVVGLAEFVIDPSQAEAKPNCWMYEGAAVNPMTEARAAQIVGGGVNGTASTYIPQTNRIVYTTGVSTDINSETIAGLQTYFATLPAPADGARYVAFAVGGTDSVSCIRAEMEILRTGAAAADLKLGFVESNGVGLGVRIKDDAGAMLVTYNANPLVSCNGVIFGSFAIPDQLSGGVASILTGDKCILTLTFH